MFTIWRVENYKGRGPYSSMDDGHGNAYSFFESSLSRHSHIDGHPGPHQDRGIDRQIMSYEICGFLNEEQARNWFSPEELIWLQDRGFYLKQVKVSQITAIGRKQVLAIRTTKEEAYELEYSLS